MIPVTLTIAGSDTSGGAGMQADLKTFEEYGTYGVVALTSVVTMNPENGWSHDVFPLEISLLEKQLKTILAIQNIKAMKTGMLNNLEMIKLVKKTIEENNLENIVIDPVMVCKGDNKVLNPENANGLRELLVPMATVTTPNLFEASVLAQTEPIKTIDEMKEAAKIINELGAKNVVIKGGKALEGNVAIDILYDGNEFTVLECEKVSHGYNHGAGCTFAAAVTAGLAKGLLPKEAVEKAKLYVTEAISKGFALNGFIGAVYHPGGREIIK